MSDSPLAVSSVVHYAAPVKGGQQCCARCGAVLQEGPAIGEWPAGIQVVASFAGSAGQVIPFEGVTPGQFPDCTPAVPGG